MQWIDCEKNYSIFFYEWLILMIGLTSVTLSAIIMSNIFKIIYMKHKQKESKTTYFIKTIKTLVTNESTDFD